MAAPEHEQYPNWTRTKLQNNLVRAWQRLETYIGFYRHTTQHARCSPLACKKVTVQLPLFVRCLLLLPLPLIVLLPPQEPFSFSETVGFLQQNHTFWLGSCLGSLNSV